MSERTRGLLVIGSRGHGALRSAALGSVSRELASSARSPVVIVPSGERSPQTDVGVDDADPSVVGTLRGALLGSVAAELPARAARPVVVLSPPAAAEAVRSGS